MQDREYLARTFDSAAELYDEVRPGYPEALFDDLCELSAVPEGARVLEIGCGTGQATLPLARRGYHVLCLEPGANLAAVARRNLAAFALVEIVRRRFEEWELEPQAFDLVAAASSFKWLDPEVRYRKTAAALRSGGCVALFRNAHVLLPGQDAFFEAVQEAYRRHTPQMAGDPLRPDELPTTVDQGFLDTGVFEQVAVRHYPWTEMYDTGRYLKVLQTYSGHIALPETARRDLLADIAGIIDREFGGRVVKHWVTVLQVARRVAD